MRNRCENCAVWQERPGEMGICHFPQTRMFVQIPKQNGLGTLLTAPDFGCVEFQERTHAA